MDMRSLLIRWFKLPESQSILAPLLFELSECFGLVWEVDEIFAVLFDSNGYSTGEE